MATSRFEILIEINGVKYQLDTYKTEPISLNYNVNDIKDISSRNSSYSKTITLPDTKNNRQIFGNISDLSVDCTFNPNKKTKAYILVDTIVVFDGYLQLRSAVLDENTDTGNYEIVIFADNDNFFKELGAKYLTDMDFSEFNHDWDKPTIINSWTQSWEKGFYYPLIDYGNGWEMPDLRTGNGVGVGQMFPATNVKVILNKIFHDAGFTYQSNFLNSAEFENLYIPFSGEKMSRSATYSADKFFRVSRDINQPLLTTTTYSIPSSGLAGQYLTFTVSYNNEASPLNFDPQNVWSTTLFEYTHPLTGNTDPFIQALALDGTVFIPPQVKMPIAGGGEHPEITVFRSRNSNGTTASGWPNTGNQIYFGSQPTFKLLPTWNVQRTPATGNGTTGITYSFYNQTLDLNNVTNTTGNNYPLFPGEKIKVKYSLSVKTYNNTSTIPNGATVSILRDNNRLYNRILDEFIPNQTLDYNSVIPKNFKQTDFISSLVKMFNLIIEPSKEYDKMLIIEPRDDYYASGVIKDWTRKLDKDTEITAQILGETQNRITTLKYKDDKDYYNEVYRSMSSGLDYGTYEYIIDNDFITGEKKIELAFSPTPIVSIPQSTQFVIPVIGTIQNDTLTKTAHNTRILQRYTGGLLPVVNDTDKWKFEGVEYSSYPYLGHYDNPQDPSFDINFGQVIGNWQSESTVTNDTLYDSFYKQMLDEISDKDSRIITASFYLTPDDIYNFKFNDKIFIDNQYYKINKISNYDPTQINLTEVELIKTKFVTVPRNRRFVISTRPARPGRNVGPGGPITGPGTWGSNNGNVVLGADNVVTGVGNVITGPFVNVSGVDNVISSPNTGVNGTGNVINGAGRNIFFNGDFNTAGTGVSNSVVYGVGNTLGDAVGNVITSGGFNIVRETSKHVYLNGDFNDVGVGTTFVNMTGAMNVTGTNSTAIMMMGSNNNIGESAANAMIMGDNSQIGDNTNNTAIFVNNSAIANNLSNTFVFDDNVTATQSNTAYFDNIQANTLNNIPVEDIIDSVYVWTEGTGGEGSIVAYFGGSTASGQYSLAQGLGNTASGDYSQAFGQSNLASGEGSNVIGLSNKSEGMASFAGGIGSSANSAYSFAFGQNNTVSEEGSVVLGGISNAVQDFFAAVVGGFSNTIQSGGLGAFIGGGNNNIVSGEYSAIIGGFNNIAPGSQAILIGAQNATASGGNALVAASSNSTADNNYSSIISSNTSVNAAEYSSIIAGLSHSINFGVFRTAVIGGSNSNATQSDTVYVPYLNIRHLNPTTAIAALGIDANGYVTIATASTGVTSSPWVEGTGGPGSIVAVFGGSIASGSYSLAQGLGNTASGNYAQAFGEFNHASGINSHAVGYYNVASGVSSFVSGALNVSSGTYSYSEGNDNISSGIGSHAEGVGNQAINNFNHAEGLFNTASGIASHVEGRDNIASGDYSHVEGRLGTASGIASHVEGFNNIANIFTAHAEGSSNIASGRQSHAEGLTNIVTASSSHVEGSFNLVSGISSHGEGHKTKAFGFANHVEGIGSTTSGSASHAEGYESAAVNNFAHAEGQNTIASGERSHSEGYFTRASGDASHAEGSGGQATNIASHAEGFQTLSTGIASHAEGYYPQAIGTGDHAEGMETYAAGGGAHAEGQNTFAINSGAHAEGGFSTASGMYAHAEGQNTIAAGDYSHAEGSETTATGIAAHASGVLNNAVGDYSQAGGIGSSANFPYTFAFGQNNTANEEGSAVLGGLANVTNDFFAAIVGGFSNTIQSGGLGSFIGGGNNNNVASGEYSAIIGGFNNITEGSQAGIIAVQNSTASGGNSFLAAGSNNITADEYGSIISGNTNVNSGIYSSIIGGQQHNIASGVFRTVVLGATGCNATQSETVYVPYLNISRMQPTTAQFVLGIDANGFVTTASVSATSSTLWIPSTGFQSITSIYGGNTSSGVGSLSFNRLNLASGSYSVAGNELNVASGYASSAFGSNNRATATFSQATGNTTIASGIAAHSEGNTTQATGHYSHAEGNNNYAQGEAAHAEGYGTIASGPYAHSEGFSTLANGQVSHAEGESTVAQGRGSHAEGQFTTASNDASHAEGYASRATGYISHAEGRGNLASGTASHAEGGSFVGQAFGNTASGESSHAEGFANVASNFASHAEGRGTIASGQYSHSQGFNTRATGVYSHAQNIGNTASGIGSSAEGNNSIASGLYSSVGGDGNLAAGTNAGIVGGSSNHAAAANSFIGGGSSNSALLNSSAIIGGASNFTQANFAFVGGGQSNNINGINGTINTPAILGGRSNDIRQLTTDTDEASAIVAGGSNSLRDSSNSVIIGGVSNILTSADRTVVLGGSSSNATQSDTVYVPFLNISKTQSSTPSKILALDANGYVTIANISATTSYQPLDSTLTALAAFNTNGIMVQTAADTFTGRTLIGPAAGITISNPDGVAGNPTFALANDLSALEGLSSTGFAVRTGTDTWAQRALTASNNIFITNGDGVAGNPTIGLTGGTASGNFEFVGNLKIDNFEQRMSSTVTTTDATVTTIITIPIETGKVYEIESNVLGRVGTVTSGISGKVLGTFKNNGGTVTQIGSQNNIINTDNIFFNVTMTISGTNVLIRVTGFLATTVNWGASTIIYKF